MAEQTPVPFVFYFAASTEKAWEGFVSSESNRMRFMGAELETNLMPGGRCIGYAIGPTASAYLRARRSA